MIFMKEPPWSWRVVKYWVPLTEPSFLPLAGLSHSTPRATVLGQGEIDPTNLTVAKSPFIETLSLTVNMVVRVVKKGKWEKVEMVGNGRATYEMCNCG